MKKTLVSGIALACLVSVAAQAQEAPAPQRMPRTPVSREITVEARDPMPASRQVQGPAAIIDGEKMRIGDTDIRLFGVVPPQLAASFGPQARSALDVLANGQSVTCQIRDRDRDGRLLATCHNAAGNDMALELLKHGLAVTARGSIAGTELSTPYLAAEQAAQSQKIGLWSVSIPAAVVTPSIAAPKPESVASVEGEPKKEEKVTPRSDKASAETQNNETQAKIAADIIGQRAQTQIDDSAWESNDDTGFFERYQILIACSLMLVTALSVIGALWMHKRRDRLDEIKAIAAALRGELMAARGVCFGRAKSITNEDEDRAAIWPRIRATLYQAYVSRLGLLGAELSRQIASIYGQSSDYAAFYNAAGAATDSPKKQALETLLKNIDEVLPKLATIEQSGAIPPASAMSYTPRSRYDIQPAIPSSAPTKPAAQVAAISPPRALIEKKTEKAASTETAEVTKTEEPKPAAASEAVTMAAPVKSAVTETTTYTPYVQTTPTAAEIAARTPVLLWEAVRGFIQNHRNAIADPQDTHSGDYASIIEAEMARYQYGDNIETFDVVPKKKQG
jgi:endonuclease YncB( thermonuclease family)